MKGFIIFFINYLFLFPGYLSNAKAQTTRENTHKVDFGLKTTLNFTKVKSQYDKYLGIAKYSLAGFINYRFDRATSLSFEPTFTASGLREKQSDNRYSFSHLDLSINGHYKAFRSDDISFYFGIRPALLLNTKSEVFVAGDYVKSDIPGFKNDESGTIDLGVNIGMAVRLSKVVSFEAGYCWSATNQTNADRVKGRPSLVEISLKINAVDIKNIIDNKATSIHEKVKRYQKGALLVMLPTLTEKDLARFTNSGDRAFAVNELKLRNLRVMREFRKHYTFTPVFFFFDTEVDKVIANAFDGVFLNDNMEPDNSIKLENPANFFVASFCNDLSNYTQRISYGLFVYDDKMIQLEKPFNVPGQVFGLYTSGDPVNYFRTKRQSYINMPFEKMIKKFSARMTRYAEFE